MIEAGGLASAAEHSGTYVSGVVDVCDVCVGQLVYCDRYDADLCPVCDTWVRNSGADCGCTLCADRPARPSECRHPTQHPSFDE